MTENTLLSTNQSPTAEDTPSKPNSPTPSLGGMNLSDIPHFSPFSQLRSPESRQTSTLPSAPVSYDDGKVEYEYEFTCIFTDNKPMFVGLWDADDLTACQRVAAQNFGPEEIVYNEKTGIGFFSTVDGLRWCFKKQPVYRSIGPINPIGLVDDKPLRKVTQTAEDILASL